MRGTLEVTAAVVSYLPNAMQDTFDDGEFASYDATRLRISSPEERAGEELEVYHDGEVPPESPWRQVGRQVTFRIDAALLGGEKVLFDGAVTDLQLVP